VDPRHRGKARPRVMDARTASNMKGCCEYIK